MNINEIIAAYNAAHAEKTRLEKIEKEMKALILDHAGDNDHFSTDVYTVFIKTTMSDGLDTKALYKDFPDIKAEYGRPSEKIDIVPPGTPEAMQTTASARRNPSGRLAGYE